MRLIDHIELANDICFSAREHAHQVLIGGYKSFWLDVFESYLFWVIEHHQEGHVGVLHQAEGLALYYSGGVIVVARPDKLDCFDQNNPPDSIFIIEDWPGQFNSEHSDIEGNYLTLIKNSPKGKLMIVGEGYAHA